MDTAKLLWFFLWRMGLLGFALGTALGALYGALIGALGGGGAGAIVGFFYGYFYGAVPGLGLALLEGLLLGFLTRTFYRRHMPPEPHEYREVAGWACAAVSLLTMMAFVALLFYEPPAGIGLLEIVRFWAFPVLAATSASWWASRKVVGWYARGG